MSDVWLTQEKGNLAIKDFNPLNGLSLGRFVLDKLKGNSQWTFRWLYKPVQRAARVHSGKHGERDPLKETTQERQAEHSFIKP